MGDTTDPAFEALLTYIKETRGFDFTGYKRPSLMRRIGRRMDSLHVADYEGYLDRLQADPDEFTELFDTILINVTGFFRDQPVWDHLANDLIPRLLSEKQEGSSIRVWCAGSASGEEAYSIAMLFAQELDPAAFRERVKVFATDVDEDALATGRRGRYTDKQVEAIPPHLRDRFLRADGDGHVFGPELRRSIVFGRHDLVQDAPISRTDLILCRNTIMYMNADTQARVIANLAFSLNEGGSLVLGKSEMLFSKLRSFAPVDIKRRVFAKVDESDDRGRGLRDGRPFMATSGERLAFDLGPVAQVLVDGDGVVTHINRRARELLALRMQDVGKGFERLGFAQRPVDLRPAVEQAQRIGRVIGIQNVSMKTAEGHDVTADIHVVPLLQGDDPVGTIITFTDVTADQQLRSDVDRSNIELATAMEELQSTNEELETTNEELQSTNEELETTNEELQSTNEELETMNEELQSTNEELETMNEEMSERTLELGETNRFVDAILGGLDAGVVVVGPDLRIRTWHDRSEDLWGVRDAEVTGRLLQDVDIGLPMEPIRDLARTCLLGGDRSEVVVEGVTHGGRPIRCRVSCSPLGSERSQELHGVVLVIREVGTDELTTPPERR
jgi:two-component system CheB/CheR fusion protein